MKLEGGCYCGQLRYEITDEPRARSQCHCRECQYISGGGPNYFMLIPEDGFSFSKGSPREFSRNDLDNPVTRLFCETCGTHIATRRPGLPMMIVKAGTLDNPEDYGLPGAAIYTCDLQPYHHIPEGMPSFEKLP